MMQKVESCFYGESDGWQAVELRLAYRDYLSMFVLLPQEAGSLAKLEKELDAKMLNELFASMKVRRVDIELPKFKIASSASLKEPLKSLGMPLAFSDQADLSAIGGQEKPHLDAVYHKTVADVSEMGTESAADAEPIHASDDSIEVNAAFHANQPFLFLIRDNYSSTLLFIGRVIEPTAGEKE
jgi:serpin B